MFIFIGYKSNNVVVISSDGQRHIQLLSSKDDLVKPYVLDYDKSTNRLLVLNNTRTAFLFDVTMFKLSFHTFEDIAVV
jgi:hypothetical protein